MDLAVEMLVQRPDRPARQQFAGHVFPAPGEHGGDLTGRAEILPPGRIGDADGDPVAGHGRADFRRGDENVFTAGPFDETEPARGGTEDPFRKSGGRSGSRFPFFPHPLFSAVFVYLMHFTADRKKCNVRSGKK